MRCRARRGRGHAGHWLRSPAQVGGETGGNYSTGTLLKPRTEVSETLFKVFLRSQGLLRLQNVKQGMYTLF